MSRRSLRNETVKTNDRSHSSDSETRSLHQRKGRRDSVSDVVDLTINTTDESIGLEEVEHDSGIECMCCLEKHPFESMGQCNDGHLVCVDCFTTYTSHQIYGPAKLELHCMADDCSASYPRSEMTRCLSSNIVAKWDERIQEENLKMSDLELSRCPDCHFACILSPTVKVLNCQREACGKKTCRECGLDWSEHEGKPCVDMENKDETTLRKKYEEKMTKATLRACPKCSTPFFKEDGCNKMTCHCGTTMCYICREGEIKYEHFCSHPHSPGKGCTSCDKCYLWTSTKDEDDRALLRLKRKAEKKRQRLGYSVDKAIGAPVPKKKSP